MNPRFPRSVSGRELVKALEKLEYRITRKVGSHIQLTTLLGGKHSVTVPDHSPMRIGTFRKILRKVAIHHHLTLEDLLELLFKK